MEKKPNYLLEDLSLSFIALEHFLLKRNSSNISKI